MGKLKITRKTKLLPPVYIIIYHYLSLYHIISHPMFFLLNSPYENIRENSAAPGPWSKGWLPPRLLPGSWCTESPRPPAPRRRFRTRDLYGSLQNQPRSLIKMDLIVGIRIEHPTIAIIYGKVSSKWTTPQFNYIKKKTTNFNPLKITFCHLQPLLGLLNARHAHLHVMPKRCVPLDPASLRSCGKPQQKPTPIYLFLEGSWWGIVANFNT